MRNRSTRGSNSKRADQFDTSISKRTLLKGGLALGAIPLASSLGSRGLWAAEKPSEVVLCNWGGEPAKAYEAHYGTAFEAADGVRLVVDGSGPLVGKIRAMVDADNVVWDICDTDIYRALDLGGQGYLEPIDYGIVDRSKVRPDWAVEHGIAGYSWSWVRAWRTDVFGQSGPASWDDFWNVSRYPGKRAFYKSFQGASEIALIADGVDPKDLYPLDIERAAAKLKQLGDSLVLYSSLAESQRAFSVGEFTCGVGLHTRLGLARDASNGLLGTDFNSALYCNGAWIVPKGNPAGAEWASRFIAITQRPELQAAVFEQVGSGPVNPDAIALIPEDKRWRNPSDPANLAVSIVRNEAYYAANAQELDRKFRELMAA